MESGGALHSNQSQGSLEVLRRLKRCTSCHDALALRDAWEAWYLLSAPAQSQPHGGNVQNIPIPRVV